MAKPNTYQPSIRDAIAVIPAKYYSRRCPEKNFRPFHGKPMLAYSIETAKASGLFSEIVVASDSAAIDAIAEAYGASTYERDADWSDIGTQELAGHVLGMLQTEPNRMACVIYATAPMLNKEDLWMAFDRFDPTLDAFIMAVGAQPLRDAGLFYAGLAGSFMHEAPLIGSLTRMMVIPENRICEVNTMEDMARCHEMYAKVRRLNYNAPFCHHPEKCGPVGRCLREIACND
jgi:pseudaminic acid cytidylyltransferase